jgi:hypothetical protein
MSLDQLFLLTPGFEDTEAGKGKRFFCPHCTLVDGALSYYPEVREKLDIQYVSFARPRQPLIEVLGEAHQACPTLVIGQGNGEGYPALVSEATGRRYVAGAEAILDYLAHTYETGLPHP